MSNKLELPTLNKWSAVDNLLRGNDALQAHLNIDYERLSPAQQIALWDTLFMGMMMDQPITDEATQATRELFARLATKR